jgi:hypothetical protein
LDRPEDLPRLGVAYPPADDDSLDGDSFGVIFKAVVTDSLAAVLVVLVDNDRAGRTCGFTAREALCVCVDFAADGVEADCAPLGHSHTSEPDDTSSGLPWIVNERAGLPVNSSASICTWRASFSNFTRVPLRL